MLVREPRVDIDEQVFLREMDFFLRETGARREWHARRRAVDRGAALAPYYMIEYQAAPSGKDDLDESLLPTRKPWLRYVHQTQSNPRRDREYLHPVSAEELNAWLADFQAMFLRNEFTPPGFKGDFPAPGKAHPAFAARPFIFQIVSPTRTVVGYGPLVGMPFGALRARVTDAAGASVANVEMVLSSRDREFKQRTGADGSAWFSKVTPGMFTVSLRGLGLRARIDVEEFGVMKGTITEMPASTGPECVEWVSPDGVVFSAPVSPAGGFESPRLPAFPYKFRIPGFLFRASVALGAGARTLGGLARDESGKALPDVQVEVVSATDHQVVATRRTGAGGEFRFETLPDGHLAIRVPGFMLYGTAVNASSVRGTVAGAEGSVTVELVARGTVVTQTTTDADGSFRFESLTPGEYALRVPNRTVAIVTAEPGQDTKG